MKIEWLEYLAAFAELKSIEKVAKLYYTTPQNVGKIFRQLEDEFGFALFNRTKRRMVLTDAGKETAEIAEKVLRLLHVVKAKYRVEEELTGDLTLVGDNIEVLNNIISIFGYQHPKVDVSFQEMDMRAALDYLVKCPNVIGVIPMAEDSISQEFLNQYGYLLKRYPYSTGKSVFLCSRESEFANRKSICLNEMENIKFAIFTKNTIGNIFYLDIVKKHIGSKVRPIITNAKEYFFSSISKGLFYGITTETEFENYDSIRKNDIVSLQIQSFSTYKNYLVYHKDKKFSEVELEFIKMLETYYG